MSHLKLNTGKRPIANKYCEGKMKSTLKRRLKELEIAEREVIGSSTASEAFTPRLAGQHRLTLCESAQARWPAPAGVIGLGTRRGVGRGKRPTYDYRPTVRPVRACTVRRRGTRTVAWGEDADEMGSISPS